MPVSVFSDEDELHHPDKLKIPKSQEHRTACDVIGLAAIDLLGPGYEVFRDMNWYPGDNRPDRESPESWARRPIDELGGLAIEFDSGTLTVVMPDGTRGSRDHELLVGRERQVVDVAEGPDS